MGQWKSREEGCSEETSSLCLFSKLYEEEKRLTSVCVFEREMEKSGRENLVKQLLEFP